MKAYLLLLLVISIIITNVLANKHREAMSELHVKLSKYYRAAYDIEDKSGMSESRECIEYIRVLTSNEQGPIGKGANLHLKFCEELVA